MCIHKSDVSNNSKGIQSGLTDTISARCQSAIVLRPLARSHSPGEQTPGSATCPQGTRHPARMFNIDQNTLKKKSGSGATRAISNIHGVRWNAISPI
jgi:hypothetical protein